MSWYLEVLKKYAVFNGRARRKEYWFFVLFNVLISIVLVVIDMSTGLYDKQTGRGLFSTLYSLAVLVPGIAVGVRRLHDTGRSGWWMLLSFVLCIGWVVLLVFMALDSEPGQNRFGPNPKETTA